MIISAYNDQRGNNVRLEVDFDENYFPERYVVGVRPAGESLSEMKYPPTKQGAENARKYYRNYVSMFEKTNS